MEAKKKLTAGALLLSILLTSLASCSETEQNADETKETTAAMESSAAVGEENVEETGNYLDTAFADMSFDGMSFTIMTRAAASAHDTMPVFDHEDITGEPVDDAVYNQVTTVEEKFNVEIDYYPSNDVNTDVMNASAAGDDAYKAVIHSNQELPKLVTQNLFLDLNELEYINFENPWWNNAYKENLTIGGKTYFAFGDLFFEAAINNVHLMYFNKDMCDDYNIEYPYQAVYDGKWTLDYVTAMVEGTSKDLNGDGVMDEKDQWGLVQSPIQSSIMFYTGGFKVMSFDEEGYPYLDMFSEEFVSFYEKLYALDYKTNDIWTNSQAQEDANFNMFAEGRVLLASHFLTVVPTLREVEFEVGILPYPKYTEDSEYVNWPTGGNFLLAVPSVLNPDDYDFVGVILEALASQGYEFVRPALYDVTLQGKLARDPESQDMLDIIFDTMSVDFGWIHSGDSGMGWFVNSCLTSKLESVTSYYNRTQSRAAKYYSGIVDYYRAID